MGLRKPQALKSLNTIKAQPTRVDSKMEVIMFMDLAGKSGKAMAAELGMCDARISIIRNSPLYLSRLGTLKAELEARYMDKQTDRLTSGDPVEELLHKAALTAADKKISLMRNSSNEMVASAAASDILDRAGYKSHTEKTKVTVEVTEKMANRFEKALSYEPEDIKTTTRIRIQEEF